MTAKYSIAELEVILQRDDEHAITILPNGEIEVSAESPDTGPLRPITFREDLGGEYGEFAV